MSTQRDTRGGSTECFENGVLVLVGLGYRMFRKLGTLLQVVSETRCPREGIYSWRFVAEWLFCSYYWRSDSICWLPPDAVLIQYCYIIKTARHLIQNLFE